MRATYSPSRIYRLIFAISVLLTAVPTMAQDSTLKHYIYHLRVVPSSNPSQYKSLTAFKLAGQTGLITALHGVIGGDVSMSAESADGRVTITGLKLNKADVPHDLALLTANNSALLESSGLSRAPISTVGALATVYIAGFPLNTSSFSRVKALAGDAPTMQLSGRLPPTELLSLKSMPIHSPDPDMTILNVQGYLLPGDSGAPILDDQNRVIAVGGGGLANGTVGIGWAYPLDSMHFAQPNASTLDSVARYHVSTDFDQVFTDPATHSPMNAIDPSTGETQLFKAVHNSDYSLAYFLMSSGADPNIADSHKWTPLFLVAIDGKTEAADFASIIISLGANITWKDSDGKTPLHYAASYNNGPVADALISAGADVNAVDNTGITPLYQAAQSGSSDIVQKLLTHGATIKSTITAGKNVLSLPHVTSTVSALLKAEASHEGIASPTEQT